jgi:Rrf2 family transcriptional regulator, iron-sulfur cluster assembly transcription factor
MQLSTRGRYAVMAMVDLASRQTVGCECGPVCLAEIASSQQLSLAYLEQLFARLRRAGLVTSARGPGGGYRLGRETDRISIAAIIAAVDEPIRTTRCDATSGPCHTTPNQLGEPNRLDEPNRFGEPNRLIDRCQTHDLWAELGRQISLFLRGVTLADVVLGQVRGRALPPTHGFVRVAAE